MTLIRFRTGADGRTVHNPADPHGSVRFSIIRIWARRLHYFSLT